MATFTDKAIIDEMIECDGYYQGDPQPLAIYEFENTFGKTAWCVVYVQSDFASLFQSPNVKQETIKLLWQKTDNHSDE